MMVERKTGRSEDAPERPVVCFLFSAYFNFATASLMRRSASTMFSSLVA